MKFKFEHLAFFSLLAVLTASLFNFKENSDIVNLILGALIGAFTKGSLEKREGDK